MLFIYPDNTLLEIHVNMLWSLARGPSGSPAPALAAVAGTVLGSGWPQAQRTVDTDNSARQAKPRRHHSMPNRQDSCELN